MAVKTETDFCFQFAVGQIITDLDRTFGKH